MTIRAYLAGPDVFLPDAGDHARRKLAICARHGITGLAPLDEDMADLVAMQQKTAWLTIFRKAVEMMEACDLIIANVTPFRGASADAGTLVELGWFLGRGLPVFGYSNTAQDFSARSRRQIAAQPDELPGLTVEEFGLPDNLMIAGAALIGGGTPVVLPEDGRDRPFNSLEIFERCVAAVAARH